MENAPNKVGNLYEDIIEVYKTQYETYVNDRLEAGWKLIEVFTTSYDPQLYYKHQDVHYVLGRPKSIEPFVSKNTYPW